jgi:pyrroline-5-carboxylate reductase
MIEHIGFIGGGQMGEAMLKGLLQAKFYAPEQILVAEPVESRRDYLQKTYQVQVAARLEEIAKNLDFIVLAVKPQVMQQVLDSLRPVYRGQLIITIAAGLPLAYYEQHLGQERCPIIRAMPNMGALILQGASALCRNNDVSDKDLDLALTHFATIGSAVVVEEKLMDAVTGLSGSGPAYVFSFIEALIEGGVKTGLSRAIARDLAVQTVLGAALTLKQSDTHPAVFRDAVTSPGGTTASGLHVLETLGFKGIIIDAVEAACKRSEELGER